MAPFDNRQLVVGTMVERDYDYDYVNVHHHERGRGRETRALDYLTE